MTQVNMYDLTIPVVTQSLKALSGVLQKAEAQASATSVPLSTYLEGRIAPDMLPLTFQIQSASNSAKFIATRVAGHEPLVLEDNEKTFDDLQARIAKTIEYLDGVQRSEFDGKEDVNIELFGLKFTGVTYVQNFALPNFFFHVTTAYCILRANGVDIGKWDFLGAKKP